MAHTVPDRFALDAGDKNRMEQVCSQIGLSLSTDSAISPQTVGGESRIPFAVSDDPFYSEHNIRYLEGLMEDVKAGRAQFVRHDLIEAD